MMTAMLTVENILAGKRVYDTWCVNEDAEYHEAGDEGADTAIAGTAQEARELNADQIAALTSLRGVPERIAPAAQADDADARQADEPARKSA